MDAATLTTWTATVNFYRGVFYTTKATAEQMQRAIPEPTTLGKDRRGFYVADADGRRLGPAGFAKP